MPSVIDNRLSQRFVLVFGLLFGGSLVFLSPPFSIPDEQAHLCRAYHCSEGKLYARKGDGMTGDDLPASLMKSYAAITVDAENDAGFEISWAKIDKVSAISLDPGRRKFTGFSNTALYTPVPYLPQTAVIWIARRWQLPPLAMLYVARLANLIVYILLAAAAVSLTPIHKWTLALVALIPMSVYLAASLSADAMTLGLSLLVVASTLRLAVGSTMPSPRGLLALGVLLVLLALTKPAYVSLCALVFMIPASKFSTRKQRWLIAGLLVGVPLAISAAWMYSLRELYVPMRAGVDPQSQLRWILSHPRTYLTMLFTGLCEIDDYSLAIGWFGWMGPHLTGWIRDTYWVALGLTAVLDGGKPLPLGIPARVVAFGTYVVTAAAMATFVYLSWGIVGADGIGGLQPRYFLPIVLLLLLPLRGGAKLASSRFSRRAVPIVAMSVICLAASATWWTLIKRYYW